MAQTYINLKKCKEKDSQLEISAQLAQDLLEEKRNQVLSEFAEDFELPGFRKGHVPPDIIKQHLDELKILEEAAYRALGQAIREIASDEKLEIICSPAANVTTLAPGNPVDFKVQFALMPEVKLGDYKKIGQKIHKREDSLEVTEQELAGAVDQIRGMIAAQSNAAKDAPLPELTDELVKKMGKFENVEGFKAELSRQLAEEKRLQQKQAKRNEMIAEVVKSSKLTVPELAIEEDLREFKEQRASELEHLKVTYEQYLKDIGKSAEEVEKNAREYVEGALRTRLVAQAIVKQENITASEEEIEKEMTHLRQRYPKHDEAHLHSSAYAALVQEKLFTLLEGTS